MILKIYNKTFDTEPARKIFSKDIIGTIEIRENVNTFNTMTVQTSLKTGDVIEGQRIDLFDEEGTQLFCGFIEQITFGENGYELFCEDQKHFLQYMILYSNTNFSNTSVGNIISQLLGEFNARSGENWTLSIDASVNQNVTKEYKEGDNYYDIITGLAEMEGIAAQWNACEGLVRFANRIGQDKSTGQSVTGAYYKKGNNSRTNINSIQAESIAPVVNAIIGKDSGGKVQKEDFSSISRFGRREKYVLFRDGDLNEQTQGLLNETKERQRVYNIGIEPNTIDVNVGDKIRLLIDAENTLLNFDGAVEVIKKRIDIVNKAKTIIIEVGEVNVKVTQTQSGQIRNIQNDLNKLIL